jgi:acyl-CoA thioester hydrolase
MRFELPEQKKLTLEMVIPIRWGDMDAMGHVNNTIYFRYLEIVRIEWLHSVVGAPDPEGEGPVIVNTFCNFLRQLKYPGDVLAKHYVANPGKSSFEAYRRGGGVLRNRGGEDGVGELPSGEVRAIAGAPARLD